MQLKVTSGERFEADAIGGIQIAICCQIRPPGGQRTDELHAGEVAQLIAKGVGSGGLDLAYEVMRGYDALVILDVSKQGGEPGTLYVMEPDED